MRTCAAATGNRGSSHGRDRGKGMRQEIEQAQEKRQQEPQPRACSQQAAHRQLRVQPMGIPILALAGAHVQAAWQCGAQRAGVRG